MSKLLSGVAAMTAVLALAPASFGAACADCEPGGGGGSGGGNAAPTAAFTAGTGSTFDDVSFTNQSTDSDGSVASSSWSFGDGGTSTATSPTHAYANGGIYTVTLTVTDNNGAQSSISHQVTIANRSPVAAFAAPDVVQIGENLAPANQSSDPEGHIASYEWTFGDGTGSTDANPAKTYGSAGTYEVVLKVTDDKGAWTFASKNVRVNAAPTAQITSATAGVAGTVTQFMSANTDSDGSIVSSCWDFGDGQQACGGGNPGHTYTTPGDYTAKLTVTDNDGATATDSIAVHIAPAPVSNGGDGGSGGSTGGSSGGSTAGGAGQGGTADGGSTGGGVQGAGPQGGDSTGGGTPPAGRDTKAPALVVPAKLDLKRSAGRLVYTVATDEAATVVAKLTGKIAGTAKVVVAAAGKGRVTIKLSSKAKKALKAAKVTKITLTTTATDSAGNKTTKVTKVLFA